MNVFIEYFVLFFIDSGFYSTLKFFQKKNSDYA